MQEENVVVCSSQRQQQQPQQHLKQRSEDAGIAGGVFSFHFAIPTFL